MVQLAQQAVEISGMVLYLCHVQETIVLKDASAMKVFIWKGMSVFQQKNVDVFTKATTMK